MEVPMPAAVAAIRRKLSDEQIIVAAGDLDTLRVRIARLRAEEDVLEADLIAALEHVGKDYVQFAPRRRAWLERPERRTLDPERFTNLCRRLAIDPGDVARCLKQSVSLTEARKLVDPDDLEQVVEKTPGSPRIAFKDTDPEAIDPEQ